MITITRAEIVSNVRTLLADEDRPADEITLAANWFVFELCNNNKLRMMEDSATLSGALNDTELAFPTNFMTLINMYLTVPQVYNMRKSFVEYESFMQQYPNFATANVQQASTWTDFGNKARFAAPLNGAHTFQIDYRRVPVPMTADASICEIPGNYAEMICKGTKARIMEIDEDYAEAQQERTLNEPLITAFVKNESRGGIKAGPTVMNSNRRGSGSRMNNPFGEY